MLNTNEITGQIDLTRLPDEIQCPNLESNNFTGEVDLTQLPDGILCLFLKNNQLSGSFVIKQLPAGIIIVDARGNRFHCVAVFNSETHAAIQLQGSDVTLIVDENGKHLITSDS